MIIKKILTRSLGIKNPTVFAENKRENTLILLNRQYLGRCFEDGWIERILDDNLIMGDIDIDLCDNEFGGNMLVQFTVEIDPLLQHSPLLVKIEEIKGDIILAECDRVNILIPVSYTYRNTLIDLSRFTKGDIIPVKISNRNTPIAKTRAIANGQLFIPTPISWVFICTDNILLPEINTLTNYADFVNNELKKYEKHDKYNFVLNYIYPYNDDKSKEIDRTKKQTVINIAKNLVDLKNKKIIFDSRINWVKDPCLIIEDIDEKINLKDFGGEIKIPLHQLIVKLLSDYIVNVEFSINLIKNFSSTTVINNKFKFDIK
jgi:hypothetical protein